MKIGPDLGSRVEKPDPILDRSPTQKYIRVEKLRKELAEMGFSVVPTEWVFEQKWKDKVARTKDAPKRTKPCLDRIEQAAG